MLSGPRADLLPRETAALKHFVAGGGSLLVMIDPMAAPNLSAFLNTYGVGLAQDLVYDPSNRLFGGDALSPIVSLYNTGVAIVKDFAINTIFPLARSVEPLDPLPHPALSVAPFCRTGPGSWARFTPGARRRRGVPLPGGACPVRPRATQRGAPSRLWRQRLCQQRPSVAARQQRPVSQHGPVAGSGRAFHHRTAQK